MAIRTTMADLITYVRRNLPAVCSTSTSGAADQPGYVSDQAIQDALDAHRVSVRYAPLRPTPTLTQGALYNYTDYYSDVGFWEADGVLSWVNFATVTPATSDWLTGHWTFDLPAPGQYPPVYLTGKYYDIHYAIYDVLQQVMASLALSTYTFTADGSTFQRGQIMTNLQALADQHLRQVMATSHKVRRADVAGAYVPWSIASGGPGDLTGGNE